MKKSKSKLKDVCSFIISILTKLFTNVFLVPFWKTYEVAYKTKDGRTRKVMLFRGFTWEVVNKAFEVVAESDGKKLEWKIAKIRRIY